MLLFTEKGRKGLLILFLLSVIGGFGYAFVTAITPVSLVLFYVLLLALYEEDFKFKDFILGIIVGLMILTKQNKKMKK